ncbi:MAG: addiction module protein [Myxococcales bacterium]|nr:addiction module protein [Myxococcales bacterium]
MSWPQRLLDSVEGQPDAEWERAWVEEIERRVSAARPDPPGAPWEEVRARLLTRFAR